MSPACPTSAAATQPLLTEVQRNQVALRNRPSQHDLIDAVGIAEQLELEIEQLREEHGDVRIARARAREILSEPRPVAVGVAPVLDPASPARDDVVKRATSPIA